MRPEGDRDAFLDRDGPVEFVDDDRVVDFVDDDVPTLPDQTRDDTDEGWGERPGRDDDWLREQRPPHWD